MCLFFNALRERLFLRLVRILLWITLLFWGANARSQSNPDSVRRAADSLRRVDSLAMIDALERRDSLLADSLANVPPPLRDTLQPVLQHTFASDSFRYYRHPFFSFTNPVRYTVSVREWQGKEVIFYSIVGLLILFALIKNTFRRYVSDLFSSYFRTTVRQRQVKEQLLQNPLPSLLFNVFFVLSGALFASLLAENSGVAEDLPFWMLALYGAAVLTIIYIGKFLLLKFFGWVFQLSEATDTYIFVVFSTNKVLGIILLPFTILLAFTDGSLNAAAVTLSFIFIACLFIYRYFLAYISINRNAPLTLFHFLLYLAAVEIVPLLLINKLLFLFLREIY